MAKDSHILSTKITTAFVHLRYVSWYKYLIVSLLFSEFGNLFLIAPFPDLCLLVPFCVIFMFEILMNR